MRKRAWHRRPSLLNSSSLSRTHGRWFQTLPAPKRCSPYQFAIRSSRVGFAGPRVIRETTGVDIPPDYHSARNALKRGHIQGIWDRREFRRNLHKALLTMGSPSLYYR